MNTDRSPEPISTHKVPILGWLPWLLLLGMLGITSIFTWQSMRADRARHELHFARQIDQHVEGINRQVDTYIYFLEATQAHLVTQGEVSAQTFYRYVEQLEIEAQLPGVQAVGFISRTTATDLPNLISRITREGISDFQVSPEAHANELAILTYIHPLTTTNRGALGYNMFTEKTRKTVLELAAESRKPAASARLQLIQDSPSIEQPGFIIVYPTFFGSPSSPQGSQHLAGWVYCGLRVSNLLESVIGAADPSLISLAVYDGQETSPENRLYESPTLHDPQRDVSGASLSAIRTISIADRTWTLAFTSRPELGVITGYPATKWIPFLGGLISLLFFGLGQLSAASHRRVFRQREWLRVTLESIGDAVIATDAHGKILFLNSSAETLTGWRHADALGAQSRDVLQVIDPTTGTPINDIVMQVLRSASPLLLSNDLAVKRRDGTMIPVEDSASPIRDASGNISGAILVLHDISPRKRKERLELASAELIRIMAYAGSLDQAASDVIKQICAGLQCDTGALWTTSESNTSPNLRVTTGLTRASYELAWEVIKTSQPLWIDLTATPALPLVSAIAAEGYATAIALPIISRQHAKGALCFASHQVLSCHPEIMQWLSSLRLQIGQLAEQKQAENRRQAIIEGAFDSIISFDARGMILDANEAAEQMFGCSRIEMRKSNIDALIESPDLLLILHQAGPTQSSTSGVIVGSIRSLHREPSAVELTVNKTSVEGEVLFTAFIRSASARVGDLGIRGEILHNLTEGVCVTDEHGTIIFCNRGQEQMLHYEPGELIGTNITSLFASPGETLPALIRTSGCDPLGAEHFSGELSARCKGGAPITTFTQVSVINFRERRYLLCVQDDITDTKRWQSTLIESEHRFRTMANSLPVLVWTADHTKRLKWANRSLLEFAAVSLETEIESALLAKIHPDDRNMYAHTIRSSLQGERELEIEYRLRRFDGTYRWIWEHGVPLYEAEHTLTGYIGSGIDITDRKEAEQARSNLLEAERAARGELERISQIKDEFLATLSHELRTPLNAILGWSHLIRRDTVDPQRIRLGIEIIEKNAKAQAKMIEDLLDMSRIISGKVRIEARTTEMYQALTSAIESVSPTATAKGIEIHLHSDVALGRVLADPHRLQQILLNLLSNAVRFSKHGAAIDVTAAISDGSIVVSVRDYGEGIRLEFLPHVFDRFRQADSSTTRKHSGLGLGLAIVKHLVELHGGHVKAESAGPGTGATFTLSLPLLLERWEANEANAQPGLRPLATEPYLHHRLEGVRVLAVDDEPDARNLLKAILEDEGASVTTAGSSHVALEAIEECLPDLILSDIGMPGEDGYQFMRRLRTRDPEHGGSVPAIALTAFARPEDREQSIAAGFQAHMAKPIDPSKLVQTVTQILHP